MKSFIRIFLLESVFITVFLLLAQSCNNNQVQTELGKGDIPALLTKQANIGSSQEQQLILKRYKMFTESIRKNPKDNESKIYLAHIFMNEARLTGEHGYYYPAALKMLDNVLIDRPRDTDIHFKALLLKSIVKLSLHQFNDALVLGKAAVKLNPHNAQIYGVLVDAHVELGNYQEAVAMSDKMLSIRPDLRSYSRASYLRELHGDIQGAKEAMELAIQAGLPGNEDKAWCRVTLGNIEENYGNLKNAMHQYEMALAERPNYPFAIAGVASVLMKKGEYEKAETKLLTACKMIPEVSFYEMLADIYFKTGREEKAKEYLEEVFVMLADDEAHGHKMNLEYASIHLNLTGNFEEALDYTLREFSLRPKNISVNKSLAAIYLLKGKIEKANSHIVTALKTNSKDPETLSIASAIYTKRGEIEKGKKFYKRTLELNPKQDNQFFIQAKQLLEESIAVL